MTSVTYELWDDTGYTESGVERPPIGATLSSPDHVFTLERPNRDDMFSKLSVREDYVTLMNTSYLRATYSFNESEGIVIYGWVDNVELKSDTSDYPMVNIYWHPDLWRTYCQKAVFRAGTVRRRPLTADVPPQPYPYRYMRVDAERELIPQKKDYNGNPLWWFYMTYVEEDSDGHYTTVETYCFPASVSNHLYVGLSDSNYAESPSIRYTLNGLVDEYLGLMPSRIVGCFMSPIAPVSYTGTGSQSDPINMQGSWYLNKVTGTQYGPWGYYVNSPAVPDLYEEYSATLPTTMRTTDTDTLYVTGFDGEPLAALPWGLGVKGYTYRMTVDAVGAYVTVRFNGLKSRSEGLGVTIPCVAVSITQNSWSEYVYSGQRQYDKEMRNLQSVQELERGLTSAVTGAGEQAGLSTMFGGLNTVKGRTMAKGGAITAGAAALGSAINFGADMLYFNNEYQHWEDYAAAHQTDNLALPGSGWDIILFGRTVYIVTMRVDAYSSANRQSDISMYGAHVTEPLSSCQSLVLAGGPLQITNMTVGGDIPVEAKEYIRMMFSNGVRLV